MKRIELKEKIGGFAERDAHSKAILNTDRNALLKHKLQKERHLQSTQEVNKMKDEICSLKDDLCEIKKLLLAITNKV
jgi:hypothetical protein